MFVLISVCHLMMWLPLAGSKAIHQVFEGKRSTTVDVSTGTAAMKVVSGVLGVLLLRGVRRYSLVTETNEDKLIVEFRSECYSVLCTMFERFHAERLHFN